jgi:hypothetical protein
VEALVAHGADRSIRNAAGLTALDVATAAGAPKFGVEKKWFDAVIAMLRVPGPVGNPAPTGGCPAKAKL